MMHLRAFAIRRAARTPRARPARGFAPRSPLPAALLVVALAAAAITAAACSNGDRDGSGAGNGEPAASAAHDGAAPGDFAGTLLPAPLPKPDFVLTDTDGRPFDFRADTAGQIVLLYFGYTSCPDVCPVHVANITQAIERSPAVVEREVQLVFVGVDAPRDTPERMRAWLDAFDSRYIGLTGTQEELDAAQLAAAVPPATRDPSDDPDRYTVSHAGWVMLYTPDGFAHLRYPLGIRQSAWAADLTKIVTEGWWAS